MIHMTSTLQNFLIIHGLHYMTDEEYPYMTGRLKTTTDKVRWHHIEVYNNESIQKLIDELAIHGELQLTPSSFLYEAVETPLYEVNKMNSYLINSSGPREEKLTQKLFASPYKRLRVVETDTYCEFVHRHTGDFGDGGQYIIRGWKNESDVMEMAIEQFRRVRKDCEAQIAAIDAIINHHKTL